MIWGCMSEFRMLRCKLVLSPESRSVHFLVILGLVTAEAIGEGEAERTTGVEFVDDVLPLVGVVQIAVGTLEDVFAKGFQL